MQLKLIRGRFLQSLHSSLEEKNKIMDTKILQVYNET